MLAAAGVASRRAAEQLIFKGCVTVNGKPALLPQTTVDPRTDQARTLCVHTCTLSLLVADRHICTQISVNGQRLAQPGERYVFALNKPKGYLCSSVRPAEGELAPSRLVVDLFQVGMLARLYSCLHCCSS